MSISQTIDLGCLQIGTGHPPLFLPDIGTFFNQDISLALSMVDQLHQSGVKIVKGEILHDANICLHESPEITYIAQDGREIKENYRSLIERKTVSLNDYRKIFSYAKEKGVGIIVSVYDFSGIEFALEIGSCALKIATSNVTHQPMIEKSAQTGLPIIIDTGDSSLEEIERAVSWARNAGATEIIVEHSPYAPPAPLSRHDLKHMVALGNILGTHYGLSDHHDGEEMLYAATALGATILETGVRPDDLDAEQDSKHALPISLVGDVIKKCANIYHALGHDYRKLDRTRPRKPSRMGIIAKADIQPNDLLNLDNLTFAFPIKEIGTEYWDLVNNKKAIKTLKAGTPLKWSDFE